MQLKPRNPAHPVRAHVPLVAVCDYKQVEVRAALGSAQAGMGVGGMVPPGHGFLCLHCLLL